MMLPSATLDRGEGQRQNTSYRGDILTEFVLFDQSITQTLFIKHISYQKATQCATQCSFTLVMDYIYYIQYI